jgi:hypothetical protein
MNNPDDLPQYWRATHRPARPPLNWRALSVVLALMTSAGALIFTGAMQAGMNQTRIGIAMIAAGALFAIIASFIDI